MILRGQLANAAAPSQFRSLFRPHTLRQWKILVRISLLGPLVIDSRDGFYSIPERCSWDRARKQSKESLPELRKINAAVLTGPLHVRFCCSSAACNESAILFRRSRAVSRSRSVNTSMGKQLKRILARSRASGTAVYLCCLYELRFHGILQRACIGFGRNPRSAQSGGANWLNSSSRYRLLLSRAQLIRWAQGSIQPTSKGLLRCGR